MSKRYKAKRRNQYYAEQGFDRIDWSEGIANGNARAVFAAVVDQDEHDNPVASSFLQKFLTRNSSR